MNPLHDSPLHKQGLFLSPVADKTSACMEEGNNSLDMYT